jgi:membrane protease YdiL (CAAX protease family)
MIAKMGLDRCPPFYKDFLFVSAMLAGGLFWLFLSLSVQVNLIPRRQILSGRFLSLVLWQPMMEELIFRGLLQGHWVQYPWGRHTWHGFTLANLLASLLFMFGHLFSHPPIWAFAVFLPSLIFGYFRDRYSSIYPPLLLHSFYNAGYFSLTGLP